MASSNIKPFKFMESAVLPLATGIRAQNLRELHAGVTQVPDSAIYFHFWGRMVRPHISESEFNNDFASWVNSSLRDFMLAEALGGINPVKFQNFDNIREVILNILEKRLENEDFLSWKKSDRDFHFIACKKLMFETGRETSELDAFPAAVKHTSRESFFYHFIDGRRRSPDCKDDFTIWLEQLSDETAGLRKKLENVDSYLFSLTELQRQVFSIFDDWQNSKGGKCSCPK